MQTLGIALSVEFYDCNRTIINDVQRVEQLMKEAALEAKATIVESVFHMFNPFGVSGVVVIAESHLAIHTWPEYGYAAIDIFTCGTTIDPWVACEYLKAKFEAGHYEASEFRRGYVDSIAKYTLKEKLVPADMISHKPLEAIAV
jgi:S-adenosylmethionine decarboxylase proenzyme